MRSTYSPDFKEQAIRKTLQRGSRTIAEMADELHIPFTTLKTWLRDMRKSKRHAAGSPKEKRADAWSAQERLQALQETHALTAEEVQAWCRERGVFAHQLVSWAAAFCAPTPAASASEVRSLQQENTRLQRDLQRKEKALAEAAALLVLQKKYQALWEDEAP